jgi:hypothetical protein
MTIGACDRSAFILAVAGLGHRLLGVPGAWVGKIKSWGNGAHGLGARRRVLCHLRSRAFGQPHRRRHEPTGAVRGGWGTALLLTGSPPNGAMKVV